MDGVNYYGICDLAREEALLAIKNLIQDRMGQGEVLGDKNLLSGLDKVDDVFDNEVFGAYESYLNYLHYIVEQTPIPLHV